MIDTHPDYLMDKTIFRAYSRFLDRFSVRRDGVDGTAQGGQRLVATAGRVIASNSRTTTWRVVGPADGEARVAFDGRSW